MPHLARVGGALFSFAMIMAFASNAPYAHAATKVSDCVDCHANVIHDFQDTLHGKMIDNPSTDEEGKGCEACHGPSEDHAARAQEVKAVDNLVTFKKHSLQTVDEKNAVCLKCHQNDDYKMFWSGSPHQSNKVACVDCHTVMKNASDKFQLAKEKQAEVCFQCHLQRKAQYYKSAHMPFREGKMVCTNCHNPHGTQTPKLIDANSVNEKCYECHMEKRGPFLWEHMPVRENCLNCHEPHGSNHDKLLKAKRPFLCQRCHSHTRHPSDVYYNPSIPNGSYDRLAQRACLNCHTQIHGSNAPNGVRMHR